MKTTQKIQILIVLLVFLLSVLACGIEDPTAEPPTMVPATVVPPTQARVTMPPGATATVSPSQPTPQPQTTPESLSSAQKQFLAHATVRIALMKKVGGKLQTYSWGSGTIISADGLILTNCHVADPVTFTEGEESAPDALVVEMVDTEDKPPVPMYFADVLASDGTLDLAVIKIARKLDGSPVNPSSLNLPVVPIGNSDSVKFGDPVYVFGFPSIGGTTITFSAGSVSGFDTMEPIGNRAWIKTDAVIAGGNSGGLATNTRAELVGVPSRLGTSSATKFSDCRRLQDTNGDGKIDDKDSCIPLGGFINAIRPVNWATSMITTVKQGKAYSSPYKTTSTTIKTSTPQKSTSTGTFTLNSWVSEVDANNCPVKTVTSYPSGQKKMGAVFNWSNMTKGDTWSYRWTRDNKEVFSKTLSWDWASSGTCFYFSLNGDPLVDGNYKLEIYTGTQSVVSGSATTKVGGTVATTSAIQVKGKVVDAVTGKGVAGALVFVLQPGVDPELWLDDGLDSEIFTSTQTDASGNFVLPERLQRNVEYPVLAGSKVLGYRTMIGTLNYKASDPDPVSITIQLTK